MAILAVPSFSSLFSQNLVRHRDSHVSSLALTSPITKNHPSASSLPSLRCSPLSSPTAVSGDQIRDQHGEETKFIEASKNANLVPLYECIFSDHFTPALAYRCLVSEGDVDAPSFLFESVEQGPNGSSMGRYSFVGAQPAMEVIAMGNQVTILDHENRQSKKEIVDNPMEVPRRITEGWNPQLFLDELPPVFCGGWVGYFSYDTIRYIEKRKLPFSGAPKDDRGLPDINLGLYNNVIVFDHVEKKKLVNRPLAGTIRRGTTTEEDRILGEQLLNDEKQCAEHIMLVDLGRNDVGKVSKPGSVKVEELMSIERYSHLMHISSTVTGELLDHLTSWDALQAALPVGTVSGAPKVKAMELIDQLEATRRGPYSGGFGGVSFLGDMDIAIVLRTIVFQTTSCHDTMYSYKKLERRKEWVAHIQAGAGIVADSNPEEEQRECENKAAGLARAIDLAESTFVEEL